MSRHTHGAPAEAAPQAPSTGGWRLGLAVVFGLPLLVLSLPITLPAVALAGALDRKRLRTAARHTVCVRCGAVLGEAALRLADERWQAEAAPHPPHTRLRVARRTARTLLAICTVCGERYTFDPRKRSFPALAPAATSRPTRPSEDRSRFAVSPRGEVENV